MKQTYLSIWGVWLFPHGFGDYSLENIRDWAKREGLAGEERFVAQDVLKELRRLYPGYKRGGILIHLKRDPAGGLSYEERPLVSVAALIGRNEECRIFRFQLRYPEGEGGTVLFNFSSPDIPGVETISSVSSSKRICHKFLRLFETLEEQGYDVNRYSENTGCHGIVLSEEVFDADISVDLRAIFSRDSENSRTHEVEFRFSPGLVPAPSSGRANLSEETLQNLIEEFFSPYRWAYDHHPGTTEGFLALLEFLVRHGGCPSVVTTMLTRDSETLGIRNFRKVLKKVTLLDHSVNVARMMLKHLKETYCGRDYEGLIPKAFIVSFGHDLGKILSLRTNPAYPDPDHPLISAQKLEEIFRSRTAPPWFPDALDLIRHHHDGSISKESSIPLRWADQRAREIEIEAYGHGLRVIAWNKWFDVKRFIEIMRPTVNLLQGTKRFNAFSLGSWVYCQPNFLYESARKLGSVRKVIDLRLHIITEREQVLRKIVQSLREAKILSDDIGESFIGRTYEVQADTFNRRMFLIPLKIEVFGSPGWIERRKEGYLQLIRKVTPVKKIYC